MAEIELEGKINPRENLISLDCAELFVLRIVNSSAHNAGRLLRLFIWEAPVYPRAPIDQSRRQYSHHQF